MVGSSEERWRSALLGIPDENLRRRRMFAHLPSSPRCKNCAAAFAGPGAIVARGLGFRRWAHNPKFCGRCLPNIAGRGFGGALGIGNHTGRAFVGALGAEGHVVEHRELELKGESDRVGVFIVAMP